MRALFLILVLMLAPAPAAAQTFEARQAVICPVPPGGAIPDFDGESCERVSIAAINPQNREIWVMTEITLPDHALRGATPLGLFVSAMASTEAWLNGTLLGSNGAPAADRATERPGRMDAVFHAPPSSLKSGPNKVLLRMSSHHAPVTLRRPVHGVAIGGYTDPPALFLAHYWPSLLTFGAFAAGALYFAGSAISGGMRPVSILLALASLLCGAQLIAESWRGLVAYPYPDHGWRLVCIVLFSLGFGLSLAGAVVFTFAERNKGAIMAAIAATSIAGIFLAESFDLKAGLAILIPTAFALAVAIMGALRKAQQAALYAAALAVFGGSIVLFPAQFLDTLFFYEVAALLFFLFVLQAFAHERERRQHEAERTRSIQLEAALQRAGADNAVKTIKVAGAGSITVVRTTQIVYCQAAGDYAELNLADGSRILHHAPLSQLEAELPAAFLRVHRSFLVNGDYVAALRRDASGTGSLTLSTGADVPVSRRIMPKVRSSLADAS